MRKAMKKTPAKKPQATTPAAIPRKTALQKASVESVLLRDLRELITRVWTKKRFFRVILCSGSGPSRYP